MSMNYKLETRLFLTFIYVGPCWQLILVQFGLKSHTQIFQPNIFSGFKDFNVFLFQNVQNYKDRWKIKDLGNS